jgi:hypothetical protein
LNILRSIPLEKTTQLAFRLGIAGVIYVVLSMLGFHHFFANDAEALRELTQITGEIYAVLLAFVVFVIWGQFNEVDNFVIQEANALDDLMCFCAFLPADTASSIRTALQRYLERAVSYEWAELAKGKRDKEAEDVFARLFRAVTEMDPQNPREQTLYARLLDLLDRAGTNRDQRIAKSLSRMPPTLIGLVRILATVLLFLVFVYPVSHWIVGLAIFIALSFVLFVAEFVVMDTDNPLKGVWNVKPQPFVDLQRSRS